MLLPGFQAEGDGETPTLTEVPAPVASFNPIKISDLGALVALGDGGRTAVYQVDLGNGFGATSMVIRAR
jgi:hypothetical protein